MANGIYYLKRDVVILNVFGVRHAHHLIGHVILNSVIFATDKWQKAKSEYFTNMVSSNSENSHQLRSCINKILHRRAAPSLPKHNSLCSLCDLFSGYF